ncbi:MAG: hypothetical protein KGJ86_07635 [Chloroflexota bacterium]|nr:hypothetical protein [Chloroflexota bacterium]
MEFRADLRCMVCSHFLGIVSGIRHNSSRVGIRTFTAGPAYTGSPIGTPTRCDKCGGHLYLDEVELVRSLTVHTAPAA